MCVANRGHLGKRFLWIFLCDCPRKVLKDKDMLRLSFLWVAALHFTAFWWLMRTFKFFHTAMQHAIWALHYLLLLILAHKLELQSVMKWWGPTWYIWKLLCSETWLTLSVLVDKAVHCRTVKDEGVAGLTQETLQVPDRQKTSKQDAFTPNMHWPKADRQGWETGWCTCVCY